MATDISDVPPISIGSVATRSLIDFIQPITDAINDDDAARRLLARIGWQADLLPISITDVRKACQAVVTAAEALANLAQKDSEDWSSGLAAAVEILQAAAALAPAINDFSKLASNTTTPVAGLDQLGADLLLWLLDDYLRRLHPVWRAAAAFLTLWTTQERAPLQPPVVDASGRTLRVAYRLPRIQFDNLANLLKDPGKTLRDAYLPAGALDNGAAIAATTDLLFPLLAEAFKAIGMNADYGLDPYLDLGLDAESAAFLGHRLSIWFSDSDVDFIDGTVAGVTIAIYPPDPSTNSKTALVLAPLLPTIDLGLDGWSTSLQVAVGGAPFSIINWIATPADPTSWPGLDATLTVQWGASPPAGTTTGLGGPGVQAKLSARVAQGGVTASFAVTAYGRISLGGGALSDGFLKSVLPTSPMNLDIQLTLVFDRNGWRFLTGSTSGPVFEFSAGAPISLGPVILNNLKIVVRPSNDSIVVAGQTDIGLNFGPFIATVTALGLGGTVKWPQNGGNAGPLDIHPSVTGPSGLGLEINSGVVTGGGFIAHIEERQEYDGILVLEIEDVVSVKAIAVLTTGPNNFSLAALVFVEDFTPIQLGLGFTLDGIGGMVAINRQADIAVLQAGIKTGIIDDLLFPADPIHDAGRIISNLERAFPIAQGRYLFGPMVQIGWGEPEPLIFAELGLLIELPSPVRLILLGKIEALLPKPEAHVVELHMDVLGVVDFAASSLALDATIHDSRVAAFAITGDMALRLIWAGPGRTFMLSVGGFNPRYQPPPGFPKLNRLAITLATSDNPKLRLDSYMALTSNTAQIGAHLELIATAGSFGVHGEVGFDALLQFEPFLFIVDIHAGIVLLVSGSPFMSLILDGTLTGPNPWHVHGDASYHVLFFSISVTVDFTIGQAVVEPPPPQPQIHANLVNALSAPGNWGAQVSQARTFVTLRKVEANGKLLAHPVGVLSAHQKVVPLEVEIERFGSVKLDHPHTFAIPSQSVKVNGVTAASSSAVPDYFAMAQFKELSDDEKLSRPSFEPYPAGVRVDAEAPTVGTPHRRDVLYDEVIVDPGAQDTHQKVPMTIDQFTAHRVPSGITRSDRLGRRRFGGPTRTIPLHDTSYLVATTDTLTRNDIAGVGARATFTQAVDALRRHTSQNVADRGRLQVVAGHEVAG